MKNRAFCRVSATALLVPNFNNIYRKIKIQFVFKENLCLVNTK